MKKLIFLLIFISFLPSCLNQKLENPESVDLIYLDMKDDIQKVDKVIKLRSTEIEEVRGEMDALPPRSKGLIHKQSRINDMSSDVRRFQQWKKYLEIKLKKRAVMAKIRYELKYKEKEPWPDQNEFKSYQIAKKHRSLPIEEINKADHSRSASHRKDVDRILKESEKNK